MSQSAAAIIEMILRNTLKEPGARDNRAAQRVPINLQVKVRPAGQTRPVAARLCNISSTGVQLELPRALSHWSSFQLNLPGTNGDVIILCMVTRCSKKPNGAYAIGAHFTQIVRGEQSIHVQAETSSQPSNK